MSPLLPAPCVLCFWLSRSAEVSLQGDSCLTKRLSLERAAARTNWMFKRIKSSLVVCNVDIDIMIYTEVDICWNLKAIHR